MNNKIKNLINKKKHFSNFLIIIFVLFFLLSPFTFNFNKNLKIEKNYSQAEVLYYLLKYRQISTGKQITDPRKFGPSEYFKCDAERKIVEKETDGNGNLMFDSVVCSAQVTGEPEDAVGGNYDVVIKEDDNEENNFDIKQYKLLAPLPGLQDYKIEGDCPLGDYLKVLFDIVLGIIAVISVVMIIYGGIEYMTSELVSGKTNGKNTIINALFGLLLALSAVLILETINPKLLNLCLSSLKPIHPVIYELEGDSDTEERTPLTKEKLNEFGIYCPGSGGKSELSKIARSFNSNKSKIKYNQDKRMTTSSSYIYLDCSSFVDQVYACAGLSISGYNTNSMFNSGSETRYDNNKNKLQVGDVLGWKPGESSSYPGKGHMVMYLGNGQMIELTNKLGLVIRDVGNYNKSYNHLIR